MKKVLTFALVLGALVFGVTAYSSAAATNNDGTTVPSKRKVQCYKCNGTGKCRSCGGKGAICINPHFNTWIDCANCYNGSCLTCGGDGIIILP